MINTTHIALVGAGQGGKAILMDLIEIPSVVIKYVCDLNPEAEGMSLAHKYGITICGWEEIDTILADNELDLILEVTGKDEVFERLLEEKDPSINLIGSSTTKIIFHFLEAQQNITDELEEYKEKLEDKIIERTELLENANVQLHQKVAEFELLNEKLQEINNSKTKYLLHATHQLKAPFAAIQSYTDILLQGYAGKLPDRAMGVIQKIHRRCDLLSESIKEMLELANLSTCLEDNISMENISLGSIVPPVISSMTTVANTRNIRITYHHNASDDLVHCNQEQVKMMVNNILDNALRYSHDNSTIKVGIENLDEGQIALSVVDQGIGIPQANIDKIFNEYFRSNNAVEQYDRGTGLGMSIVKKIADIHRCTITVASKIDEGTKITVIFP